MTDGPSSITPEQREVIQGVLAGSQEAGLKIAGLAEVTEVSPTLVGPADDPTDLGPTVELSVTVDADGRPIPRGDARDPGVVGDSVMTIRVTPHADHGGTFWRANVSVHDVETSRLYHGQSSGATAEQWDEIVGERSDAEYAEDPEVAEQLLDLEAQSPAEAVAQALVGIAGGVVVDTHKPWDTPAAEAGAAGTGAAGAGAAGAGAAGAVAGAASAPSDSPDGASGEGPVGASPGTPWLLVGGGVALLVVLVVLVGMLTGGPGDEVPVADAGSPSTSATTSDAGDGASPTDASTATGAADGLPPEPEGADEGTFTIDGDDACGHFGTLGEWSGGAGPSDEGGRIRVLTGRSEGDLTGTLWPTGDGGLEWEDQEFLADGQSDSQVLSDITIGEGVLSGSLDWTDHDGCSSTGTWTLVVPATVTEWITALPARDGLDFAVEDLAITTDDGVSVTGVLVDGATGAPVANQLVYVQVSGSEGLLDRRAVTTDAAGAFALEDAVGADPADQSLSGAVLVGPYQVGSVFSD